MYTNIMVPVDLKHVDQINKALTAAADLARHYNATVHYVAVGMSQPNSVARTPEAFAEKLERFAQNQAETHGISVQAHPMSSHDPAVDLDKTLTHAGDAIGADLIVMASHVPGFMDHVIHTHGSNVAAHSDLSVFVVR